MTVSIWPLVKDEAVLDTPIFNLRRHYCRSPKDGVDKAFYILDCREWAQVLAVTSAEEVVLVRQFRQGTRSISLELPGGVVEKGQSLEEAARRELREETGYTAERWRHLVSFRANPSMQTNSCHLFLAEGACLSGPTSFDENEELDLVTVPLNQLQALVMDGTINHVIMAAGILYYLAQKEVKA